MPLFPVRSSERKAYPTEVTDGEWAFAAPYLTLLREDAGQRTHDLREVFNSLRWLVKSDGPWRLLPHDLPPWEAVYQQARRWLAAGCFEAMAHELRALLRVAGCGPDPTAVVLDGRVVRSTPDSGAGAGYDGHKRRNGSKVHVAVDTLGHLPAARVTAASAQERAQVADVREATGQTVTLAFVDRGYTGEQPAADAAGHGTRLSAPVPPKRTLSPGPPTIRSFPPRPS